MTDNSAAWKARAKEILEANTPGGHGAGSEAAQFAASMLAALCGPASPQMKQFRSGCDSVEKKAIAAQDLDFRLKNHAFAVIRNTIAELDAGLIVNLRAAVAGEVLVEMVRLAKEILANHTEESKNVAAVLIAAAYEGLIRRMGEEFAGVTGRPKLDEVIGGLKTAGVFKGATVGVAQSYLKFRNDSLHADWKNVDRPQVESCLTFCESLLLKHFSA
jgi:hypothetical protein